MKALVKFDKNQFRIEERTIPQVQQDELLINVKYCGVCGSDLHAASHAKGYEFVPQEIVLGHEFSGIVEAASKQHEQWIGKKVFVEPGIFCNECEQCQAGQFNICSNIACIGLHYDGAMGQYVKVPVQYVHEIPEGVPLPIAALTEPLSVAMNAVYKMGDTLQGKTILVQGCGIIGFFVALVAKRFGANVTVSGLQQDYEKRLRVVESYGIPIEIAQANKVYDREQDFIFECSGSSVAAQTSFTRLKKGGTLILVALYEKDPEFPVNLMVRSEIFVLTSYAYDRTRFHEAFTILQENVDFLSSMVSVYELEDGQRAFAEANKQEILKAILKL